MNKSYIFLTSRTYKFKVQEVVMIWHGYGTYLVVSIHMDINILLLFHYDTLALVAAMIWGINRVRNISNENTNR